MAGVLIALESTNQQLLDKTAKYLALKLQSEGKLVEVLSFPQAKQGSGHFVESHQKGEYGVVNPYAASMFYILDRYDASPLIRQYLAQDTIVICKSYRGTSLAKLGASIAESAERKGFYIWADSLESGTFGVPRPDMAIVLSEELPTLYELCELFPKDYVFAIDATKVRNLLNKLVPPAPVVAKKEVENKLSYIDALMAVGRGEPFNFSETKYYVTLSKKSKNHALYADGLHEIELLRDKAVSKLPEHLKSEATAFLTPIGCIGLSKIELPSEQPYKNKIFEALIDDNFNSNYGMSHKSVELLELTPRNELDNLPALMVATTDLGIGDIQKALEVMPVQKKIELYNAYLAGADNSPAKYPLSSTYVTLVSTIAYSELLRLSKVAPGIRFSLQQATPRWGYAIPEEYSDAIDEIEDCFASSLKLYSQLQAVGELKVADICVLQGNYVQAVISLTGTDIRQLATHADAFTDSTCTAIIEQLQEAFPILTS